MERILEYCLFLGVIKFIDYECRIIALVLRVNNLLDTVDNESINIDNKQ